MSIFNLFKKAPRKEEPTPIAITFMPQDEWLDCMLEMLDEKDKARNAGPGRVIL